MFYCGCIIIYFAFEYLYIHFYPFVQRSVDNTINQKQFLRHTLRENMSYFGQITFSRTTNQSLRLDKFQMYNEKGTIYINISYIVGNE